MCETIQCNAMTPSRRTYPSTLMPCHAIPSEFAITICSLPRYNSSKQCPSLPCAVALRQCGALRSISYHAIPISMTVPYHTSCPCHNCFQGFQKRNTTPRTPQSHHTYSLTSSSPATLTSSATIPSPPVISSCLSPPAPPPLFNFVLLFPLSLSLRSSSSSSPMTR